MSQTYTQGGQRPGWTAGEASNYASSQATQDAEGRMAELREVAGKIQRTVSEQIEKAPYVVPIAAAGAGFIAGTLMASKLTRTLLLVGGGYAVAEFIRSGGVDKVAGYFERMAKTPA
jgi:hypothetical protein